jgi:ERF superfamily
MKSESIKELASALAKVKFGEIGKTKAVKVQTKTGGSYSFQYAPMEEIMSAIRGPLAKEGLSLTQSVEGTSIRVVETTLLHSSGEWMTSYSPVIIPQKFDNQGKPVDATAQEMGSAITYARRYGVTLACCLVADEDDDANIADGNEIKESKPAPKKAFETPHKPTGEVLANLSVDEQTYVHDLSNRVRTLAVKGDIKGACDEVDETVNQCENANDLRIALWEKMADMSAVRNAMKKEWATRRMANQTTEVGMQA